MTNSITTYIKNNKFTVFLLVTLLYIGFKGTAPVMYGARSFKNTGYDMGGNMVGTFDAAAPSMGINLQQDKMMPAVESQPMPIMADSSRKFITNSDISLQVKNVTESVNSIKTKVTELKGFVIYSNLYKPETGESGTMQVRIPVDSVPVLRSHLDGVSVKIVSENLNGTDVTDEYVDIQERLKSLEGVKAKLQAILDKAEDVDEILRVQQRIFDVQNQIDNWKGRTKYIDATTATSLVTIYLSTDELGLPLVEPLSWRPGVVFKHASRSLVHTVQNIGTLAIWLSVYAVILIPAGIIFFAVRKWWKTRKS